MRRRRLQGWNCIQLYMLQFVHLWVKWEKDVLKAPNSCQKLLVACMTFAQAPHAEDMQYACTRHWFAQSHWLQFFCFMPRHETMMSLLQHWSASLLKITLQNNWRIKTLIGHITFFFFLLFFPFFFFCFRHNSILQCPYTFV